MSATINPAAPHHLPGFITAPGESDVLLNGAAGLTIRGNDGSGISAFRRRSASEDDSPASYPHLSRTQS